MRRKPGLQRQLHLVDAHRIQPCAFHAQQLQNVQVVVRLARVQNPRRQARKGLLEPLILLLDAGTVVHIQRGAELLGQLCQLTTWEGGIRLHGNETRTETR